MGVIKYGKTDNKNNKILGNFHGILNSIGLVLFAVFTVAWCTGLLPDKLKGMLNIFLVKSNNNDRLGLN